MVDSQKVGPGCQMGHASHLKKRIRINLRGRSPVRGFPTLPPELGCDFDLIIFDWERYTNADDYCPGRDDFHLSVDGVRTWEGFETYIMLKILAYGSGRVLDFGSNVGWYSILAATCGYNVTAYDCVEEHLEMLNEGARLNGLGDMIETRHETFDEHTKPFHFTEEIKFIKIDVEGEERSVIRYCEMLIKERMVEYLLMEISPCFNDSYPRLVRWIVDCGYAVCQVPGKLEPRERQLFESSPWDYILNSIIQPCDIEKEIESINQANWLMIRK